MQAPFHVPTAVDKPLIGGRSADVKPSHCVNSQLLDSSTSPSLLGLQMGADVISSG